MGKLDVNSAIIVGSRTIDYAARKYAFVSEWQTDGTLVGYDAVSSGGEKRSSSIVIREEATREVTAVLIVVELETFTPLVNKTIRPRLLSSTLIRRLFSHSRHGYACAHTCIRACVRACECSASGICNAKLAGTKVINYALRAMTVCNNRVAGARAPPCTIIGPDRFSSLYFRDG